MIRANVDHYAERLQELVDQKEGEEGEESRHKEEPVILNLMDALKKISVVQKGEGRRKPGTEAGGSRRARR